MNAHRRTVSHTPRSLDAGGHFMGVGVLSYTFAMRTSPSLRSHCLALFAVGVISMLTACGGGDDATVGTVPPVSSQSTTEAPSTTASTTTTTTEALALSGEPEFDSSSSVSTVGIDVVVFGMTIAQAEQALGGTLVPVSELTDEECYQVRPGGGPAGVELTVTAGTLERVDISNDTITTRSGAGVGMTEVDLLALFGESLTSTANGAGNTIVFTPSDPGDAAFRVIFETDGTVITSFRSGRVPWIEPATPCT